MGAALFDSLYNSYDTTVLTIQHNPYHVQSIDVYYHYDTIPDPPVGQAVGLASCQVWNGHLCDHWHVIFDGDQIAGDSDSTLKSLACHETGHTLGLLHWDNDPDLPLPEDPGYRCMNSGNTDPLLGSHNVGHIDGYYWDK